MSCGLLEEVLQGPLGTGNKERVEGGKIREKGRGQIRQDHAGGVDKFRFYFKHAQWPFYEMFINLVWVLFSAATESSSPHCCSSNKCTPLPHEPFSQSCKYSCWGSGTLLLLLLLSSWWPWTGHCPQYPCWKVLSERVLTLPLTFSVIAGSCMVHMHSSQLLWSCWFVGFRSVLRSRGSKSAECLRLSSCWTFRFLQLFPSFVILLNSEKNKTHRDPHNKKKIGKERTCLCQAVESTGVVRLLPGRGSGGSLFIQMRSTFAFLFLNQLPAHLWVLLVPAMRSVFQCNYTEDRSGHTGEKSRHQERLPAQGWLPQGSALNPDWTEGPKSHPGKLSWGSLLVKPRKAFPAHKAEVSYMI